MKSPTSALCEILPWDSDFFGCRVGRIRSAVLDRERLPEVDEWSRQQHVQCLYFLARADDPQTTRTAEDGGFRLVDIRVSLERKLDRSGNKFVAESSAPVHIRLAREEDVGALQTLARAVHQQTRFLNDPQFLRERAESLYSTWIALECRGRAQRVFVSVSPTDRPVGYITCHFDPVRAAGQIGLVGVNREVRGKGVGRFLLVTALEWFEQQGAAEVAVVTQGNNIAAQRLYQQCGFISQAVQLWYHKWYPTPEASYV